MENLKSDLAAKLPPSDLPVTGIIRATISARQAMQVGPLRVGVGGKDGNIITINMRGLHIFIAPRPAAGSAVVCTIVTGNHLPPMLTTDNSSAFSDLKKAGPAPLVRTGPGGDFTYDFTPGENEDGVE